MKHRTLTGRAIWPCAMLIAAIGLPGCAQTGGTQYELATACQGLKWALANQPQQAGCGVRSSVARLASGRPLYTVLEAEGANRDMRVVRVDSELLRLEFSSNAEAATASVQRVVQGVIRP